MSVHAITERLNDVQLRERKNIAFTQVYRCNERYVPRMNTILSWHRQRIHERVLNLGQASQ